MGFIGVSSLFVISIHAPLAGSDASLWMSHHLWSHFNPRSPCGERRGRKRVTTCTVYFNPRSPCGERRKPTGNRKCNRNFNPRSPCGERQEHTAASLGHSEISIHAPLAGSDRRWGLTPRVLLDFNPRSPCGERLIAVPRVSNLLGISIHAPLAGSDPATTTAPSMPRIFQSTLPLRGATVAGNVKGFVTKFQSTLPLRGATTTHYTPPRPLQFQSTLPLRGATWRIHHHAWFMGISIHAPLAGSDR